MTKSRGIRARRSDFGSGSVPTCHPERSHKARGLCGVCYTQALPPSPSRFDRTKINARWRLHDAVKSGRVLRGSCRECGRTTVQAHHPNGYEGDSALDVWWLCSFHHSALHTALKRAP